MTEPAPAPPTGARRQGGFTLLEIMVALAVLAVGAMCVLSTFAAALMLHDERQEKVRTKLVLDEARFEAQAAWDLHRPTKRNPVPDPIRETLFTRDPALSWAVEFSPVEGEPVGLDGTHRGALARVLVIRNGQRDRARTYPIPLARKGFTQEDRKESITYQMEHRADEQKKKDPAERRPR